VNTPLVLRALKNIFGDTDFDQRIGLWSAGCTIYELFTTEPPFDNVFLTKDILIGQMVEEIGALPDRWAAQWKPERLDHVDHPQTLEDRLRRTCFDEQFGRRHDEDSKEQNEETKDEQNIQLGGLRSETIDQELRQESGDSLTKPRNESLREEMSGEEAEQRSRGQNEMPGNRRNETQTEVQHEDQGPKQVTIELPPRP